MGASDGGVGRSSPCSAVGACWASIEGCARSHSGSQAFAQDIRNPFFGTYRCALFGPTKAERLLVGPEQELGG